MTFFLAVVIIYLLIDIYFGATALFKASKRGYYSFFVAYVIFQGVLLLWALTLFRKVI